MMHSRLIPSLQNFLARLRVGKAAGADCVQVKTEEVEISGNELPRTPEKCGRKLRDSASSASELVRDFAGVEPKGHFGIESILCLWC